MCERHAPSVFNAVNGEINAAVRDLYSPDASATQSAPARVAPEPLVSARRLKLWALEARYHCPVIGTCLSLAELKKIVRKQGYSGEIDDAYSLHVEAVSLAGHRNPVSEALHKRLEQLHALSVKQFASARAPEAVLALWRHAIARDEPAGATWAAMTHRAGTADMRHTLHAELHMRAHQWGAAKPEAQRERDQVQRLERELTEQAEAWQQTRAQLSLARLETQRLRLSEQEARARLAAQAERNERLRQFENGQAFIALGRRLLMAQAQAARVEELEIRNRALTERLGVMRAEKARQSRELAELRAERDALERLWSAAPAPQEQPCDGACGACEQSLQGRCVLCVGGRTPLLPQYRQLAERLGVRLIHHDGGQEEALSRLPDLLNALDAVICPTDCVGHLAYYQLKKHCKQNGKPCVLTRNSGVAGFAAALARLAEGRADIHAQT